MKRVRSVIAIVGSLLAGQATAGIISAPFAGASDYSIVVSGNADLGSGVHVHGGAYIGGDLTLNGGNMSVGSDSHTGLYVGGSILSNQRIDLMNNDYRIRGTNAAYFQNAGSLLKNSTMDSVDVASAIQAKADALADLEDTGVTVHDSDWNQIKIDLVADTLNVMNWDATNASFLTSQNANLMFNNFTDDTFLVINYTMEDDFTFAAKNQNLPASTYANVLWNFIGDDQLTIANSVSTFKGSILAANSNVNWQANDIDGQLLAAGLTWKNTSQSHYYIPWQDETDVEVAEPTVLMMFILTMGALVARRRKTIGL
ncbi:choice-of-anchor A family protein [Alteromonas pelagimontana]|uniref:Choice-of-anchor A family protein n=1 Tax=Alteromonas pelagimontana TaxID=1858656 RepID=A0A6M4MFJ3_9ALTE|nr:collagen-binding domain-containing protein [Alteromonas pelagimontana]QJR81931.1 choice-of-anchor A family protein [Alteromonas pelagimontana]